MNFDISSDSEDGGSFAERAARKAFGAKATAAKKPAKVIPKKTLSHAFSDSDSEVELPSPKRARGANDSVCLTPPPAYVASPVLPRRPAVPAPQRQPWQDGEDLPDTEELVVERQDSATSSGLSRVNSVSSSRGGANKENKEVEKQRKQEERQRKKDEKEAHNAMSKGQKEVAREISRQSHKEEVNKYMLVVIDPAVVASAPGPAILQALRTPPNGKAECVFQFVVEAQPVAGAVSWRRRVVSQGQGGRLQEEWQQEHRCLLLLSCEELAQKVQSGSLDGWVRQSKERLGGRHLTLVVYDYLAFFRVGQNAKERVSKAKVRGVDPAARDVALAAGGNRPTFYSVEEALVRLSVERLADHATYNPEAGGGWQLCAGLVFHHTRAVAEAPLKIKKGLSDSGGFNFWAKADSKDSVNPKALPEYWKAVLMQVSSGAGLEKCSAIASLHPSPSLLASQYTSCRDDKEAELLLAEMEVRRTDNVLGGSRKVGPEISRRVHQLLTCRDPDTVLGAK